MRPPSNAKRVRLALVKSIPLDQRIITIRGQRVILDTDLAEVYGAATKRLNEQVKRKQARFPSDFSFQLTEREKAEVVAKCDHLVRLKFSPVLPRAFTEHGALMAANLLKTSQAVAMSVYVIRAFIKIREDLVANAAILKRLAEIDRTLVIHDVTLREILQKLQPLLQPPPLPPKPEIGFHIKEDAVPYRIKRKPVRV